MYQLNFILACLATLLICISPTIAFTGLNFTRFSTKQFINSILLSLIIFIMLIPLAYFINDYAYNILLSLTFYFLSERFISSFCKTSKAEIFFIIIFSGLSLISYYFFGYIPLISVLSIYTFFALIDLRKNYRLTKESIYTYQKKNKTAKIHESEKILNLKKKNDIFILLLESTHGKRGLRTLYKFDASYFLDYLKDSGFTTFDNVMSNTHVTMFSVANLIKMIPFYADEEDPNTALDILLQNGYEIQLFDSSIYPFRSILPYAEFFNLNISKQSNFLLAFATPFFTQSRFLNKLIDNIDPFADDIIAENIFTSLQKRLSLKYDKPQCYIIRTGANHSETVNYSFHDKESWIKEYQNLYMQATKDVILIQKLIEQQVENPIIFMFGDHGASSLRFAHLGASSDCNENIINNGLKPYMVSLDYTDILFSFKFPSDYNVDRSGASPCNIFRYIFRYLNDEDQSNLSSQVLNFAPNYNFHSNYLLGVDGTPDRLWKLIPQAELAMLKAKYYSENSTESIESYIQIISNYNQKSLYELSSQAIEKALKKFPNDIQILSLKFYEYLRFGKLEQAEELANILKKQGRYNEIITIYALKQEHEKALKTLEEHYKKIEFAEELKADVLVLAKNYDLACECAKKHFEFVLKNSNNYKSTIILEACLLYLQHMHAQGKELEARNFFLTLDLEKNEALKDCDLICSLFLINHLSSKDFLQQLSQYTFFRNKEYLITSYLGLLEKEGKIEELVEFALNNANDFSKQEVFNQIGLIAYRNKITHPFFEKHIEPAIKNLFEQKINLHKSGLFDEKWYKDKYKDIIGKFKPIEHYLHFKNLLMLLPNADFDPIYQASLFIARSFSYEKIDLSSYTCYSPVSLVKPSLYFDVRKYILQNPNVLESSQNILLHKYNKS